MTLDPRKQDVLNAIIQHFINTASPVGSKCIVSNYSLKVSSATIRNDMAYLEKVGLIYQPHTSAGRIPTTIGYRSYIDNVKENDRIEKIAADRVKSIKEKYQLHKAQEKVYEAVSIMAEAMPNVAFATIPGKKRAFYLGLSNILKQPEFASQPMQASQIIEILEEKEHFIAILSELGIDESIKIFIGEENLIKEIESCSIIASSYHYEGFDGYIGILGATRMNYVFNTAILKEIKKILI